MHETTSSFLATASASAPRRWLGVGTLGLLGALLLYVSFVTPPQNLAWLGFMIAMGLGAVFLADKMRRATELSVHLTETGLQDSAGQTIAALDNIARVDRGTFAFKPSNGFILRLKNSDTRQWKPGIWWRFGRRIGIGGVMPGAQTKIMAELLQAMIAERDGV